MKTNNPLLNKTTLPQFSKIKPQHIVPAITAILQENRQAITTLLRKNKYSWDNLLQPLETLHDKLSFVWSTVGHLNGVVNTPAMRSAYQKALPLVSQYYTELGQNTELYAAIKSIADSSDYKHLNKTQQKIICDELRDFRLSGVVLPPKEKQQFMKLAKKLADLNNKFSNNVLDATQKWTLLLKEKEIIGIPAHALALAAELAKAKKQKGWLFTLDFPSYYAVITYAKSRSVRQKIYTAYVTRASELGPNGGKWDNSNVMQSILEARLKLANLVSFTNYAEYSLATKMAKSTGEVLEFLHNLARKSLKHAKKEFAELSKFAKATDNIKKIEPWDIAYYSEKLRQQNFAIAQEELRPYFPANQVLEGLFKIATKLFGITITPEHQIDTWHPDVQFFNIKDSRNVLRGQIYVDLYARTNKRCGAWMDECKTRRRLPNDKIQTPVAYLNCNFTPPAKDTPALLTHNDVTTLFHEFGHCLQHVLTTVDYVSAAGIHGIPWDAVELPSQMMENWCWEPETLELISKHYKTGATLPQDLQKKLIASKNFQAAMQMLRQLEFALFDFRLHVEFNPSLRNQIKTILSEVRKQISVIPYVKFNRMQHSFSHIFAGGYAAGYYSYKWAEVLSADAFSKFEEEGIFNRRTGKEFCKYILEAGGSEEPLELFKKFRGRAPRIDALLRHSGIK